MTRIDGRRFDELRPMSIKPGFQSFAEGSVLIEQGRTRVVCSVSSENKVPPFLRGSGTGWITAEYAMLPRATLTRSPRDSARGRVSGRSHEIQRLIGRSLRAVVDLTKLGERTLVVDCDVLQADGGTRTAAITGAYVALHMAMSNMVGMGLLENNVLRSAMAATSVAILRGNILLDPCYDEDAAAEADINIVMTADGEFVEIQGTAESRPFTRDTLDGVLALAEKGIKQLLEVQRAVLEDLESSRR
jgi:ribonuclease PH